MQGPTILSPYPWVSQGVTCVDEFTVALANPAPFGNTKEILVYNTSEDYPVFIRAISTRQEQANVTIVTNPLPISYVVPGDQIVFDPSAAFIATQTLTGVLGPAGPNQFQVDPDPAVLCDNVRDAINDAVQNPVLAAAVLASSTTFTDNGYTYNAVVIRVRAALARGETSNGFGVRVTFANTVPGGLGSPWTVSPGDFTLPSPQTGFSAGGVGSSTVPAVQPADLTIANALYLPPLAAITLAVGVEGERNDLNGPDSPSGLQVAFLCGTGATNVSLSVTYVQSSGGGGTGQRTGLGG